MLTPSPTDSRGPCDRCGALGHEALRAEGDRVVTAVYNALIRFAAEAGHDVKSELDDEMSPDAPLCYPEVTRA